MKPYAMKRVNRSKSNGGGRTLDSGISSRSWNGFRLSSSCISIDIKSSFCTPPGCRKDRCLMAVRDCATVSAIPPRICLRLAYVWRKKVIKIMVRWLVVRSLRHTAFVIMMVRTNKVS